MWGVLFDDVFGVVWHGVVYINEWIVVVWLCYDVGCNPSLHIRDKAVKESEREQ